MNIKRVEKIIFTFCESILFNIDTPMYEPAMLAGIIIKSDKWFIFEIKISEFIKNIKSIDAPAIINPMTDAVAIDFLISFIKKEMYGTDSVPPPIPIKELIMPFKRK